MRGSLSSEETANMLLVSLEFAVVKAFQEFVKSKDVLESGPLSSSESSPGKRV
jgi:hypothetical protein